MSTSLFLATAAGAAEPSATDLVDALNGVFGKHGARASHAKGFCAKGSFIPAPGAQKFTRAKMFAEPTLPASMRFSIGGGNPAAPDKSRSARGLAVRLAGGGETYDLVLISEPVFFASTPASFVSFLQARYADPTTGKPDPAKIEAHNRAYPEGKLQGSLLASHAAPASYATTPYYSNHAFNFVNHDGRGIWARLVAEPAAGTHYLTPEEEKALPDVFLEGELKARLEKEAVEFDLYAQPAGLHDSLTNPAVAWGGGLPPVALGRLVVKQVSDSGCDPEVYLPTNLPAGIEPADDPILQARAAAYQVSKARRGH